VSLPQRITLITGTLLLTAVAIGLLALNGFNPRIAVIGGVWWGLAPITLLFGVMNAVVPARVIRGRERAMVGSAGYRKVVGDWFSKRMATTGRRPWDDSVARGRVRMLGICQVVVWLVVGAVILILPGGR
jgi:hypothetical protein